MSVQLLHSVKSPFVGNGLCLRNDLSYVGWALNSTHSPTLRNGLMIGLFWLVRTTCCCQTMLHKDFILGIIDAEHN